MVWLELVPEAVQAWSAGAKAVDPFAGAVESRVPHAAAVRMRVAERLWRAPTAVRIPDEQARASPALQEKGISAVGARVAQ